MTTAETGEFRHVVGLLRAQRRYHEERMVVRLHFGDNTSEGDTACYHQGLMLEYEDAIRRLEKQS